MKRHLWLLLLPLLLAAKPLTTITVDYGRAYHRIILDKGWFYLGPHKKEPCTFYQPGMLYVPLGSRVQIQIRKRREQVSFTVEVPSWV